MLANKDPRYAGYRSGILPGTTPEESVHRLGLVRDIISALADRSPPNRVAQPLRLVENRFFAPLFAAPFATRYRKNGGEKEENESSN